MRDKCNYPALRITQKAPPIHCSDRAQRSRQHPGQMLTHRDTAPETSLRYTGALVCYHSFALLVTLVETQQRDTAHPTFTQATQAPVSLHRLKRRAACPLNIEPQASITTYLRPHPPPGPRRLTSCRQRTRQIPHRRIRLQQQLFEPVLALAGVCECVFKHLHNLG